MAKKVLTQFTCDKCGNEEQFETGNTNKKAREAGWVITAAGTHFCSKECYKQSKGIQ